MTIKPKHLEFCMNYLRTNDAGVAYKMTYPKAGIKSLYAAASRLMARTDVSAWIEDARSSMQERLLREIEDTQVQAKKQQLLSLAEKRAVLTGLILGETKRTRHIRTKYGVTKVEDDQPIYAILRAIDLDTRLENFQNYLLHRDSFTAPQVPSLLERAEGEVAAPAPLERVRGEVSLIDQVNILIARCGTEELSPAGGGVRRTGVELLAQEEKASPFRGGLEGYLAKEALRETTNNDKKAPSSRERAGGEAPLAQEEASPFREGLEGYLAKETLRETTNNDKKAPSPRERAGGEAAPPPYKSLLSPGEDGRRGHYAPLPYLPLPPKKGPVYLTSLNKKDLPLPSERAGVR